MFQALQGVVEIPAIAISIYFLLKKGRRFPASFSMIISGIACVLTLPIYFINADLQWVMTSLTMISKFCISSSNVIMPVFAAELYPTTIRNIGVGAANVTAGIALMLVPYLWLLVRFFIYIPYSILNINVYRLNIIRVCQWQLSRSAGYSEDFASSYFQKLRACL